MLISSKCYNLYGGAIMKKLEDYTEAVPAFICIIAMPFAYSISEGISLGIISYAVINLVCGKFKEKKIHPLIYILAVIFILRYIFI